MFRLTVLTFVIVAPVCVVAADPPTLPPPIRLLINIDCKRTAEAPLVRKDSDVWRAIVAEPRKGMEFLGIDPAKVERVWMVCSEDYPKGTLILVEGDFDSSKFAANWQQHVRDRRFGAISHRIAAQYCVSYEIPPAVFAVPGLPASLFVATAGPKSIAVGFDKESVTTNLTAASITEARSLLGTPFLKDHPVAAVALPPAVLTAPQGILTGIKRIIYESRIDDNLNIQLTAIADNADAGRLFSDTARSGLEQIRRVFPPLAKQQGIDPRLIRFLTVLGDKAQVESEDQRVTIRVELSGDEFRKAVGKQ